MQIDTRSSQYQVFVTCGRQAILERCLKRLEWEKVQSREAKAAADRQEADRLAMQAIDWCASPNSPQKALNQ